MKELVSFPGRLPKALAVNLTSRKFLMTVFALYIEWAIYWAVVGYIYTFKDAAQLSAFVTLTNHFQWAVTTIVLGYLGIQTAANFSSQAQAKFENIVSSKFERTESKEEKLWKVERLDAKDIPGAEKVS